MPTEYTEAGTGFNTSASDHIIFVDIVDDSASAFTVESASCAYFRWPVYSMIRFNTAKINTELSTRRGDFHKNVYHTVKLNLFRFTNFSTFWG